MKDFVTEEILKYKPLFRKCGSTKEIKDVIIQFSKEFNVSMNLARRFFKFIYVIIDDKEMTMEEKAQKYEEMFNEAAENYKDIFYGKIGNLKIGQTIYDYRYGKGTIIEYSKMHKILKVEFDHVSEYYNFDGIPLNGSFRTLFTSLMIN